MRRAIEWAGSADQVDRDEVGDRDGWLCGICGEAVDKNRPWPDRFCATLDHIQPLSLGGRHAMENLRIAHLTCNAKRGARVA